MKFTRVYNSTKFAQIYYVARVDFIKQYLYNESMPGFEIDTEDNLQILLNCFLTITEEFEGALKETSKTTSFLRKEYKDYFKNYVYDSFIDIIKEDVKTNHTINEKYFINLLNFENGFKYVSMEAFEILRFLIFKYLRNNQRNETKGNISTLIYDKKWHNLHYMLIQIVNPWYNYINDLVDSYFFSYVLYIRISYIFVFIVTIIIVTLNFWIIWKKFESQYINLVKKSFELINLIPEEIKNIIVSKLNEQN